MKPTLPPHAWLLPPGALSEDPSVGGATPDTVELTAALMLENSRELERAIAKLSSDSPIASWLEGHRAELLDEPERAMACYEQALIRLSGYLDNEADDYLETWINLRLIVLRAIEHPAELELGEVSAWLSRAWVLANASRSPILQAEVCMAAARCRLAMPSSQPQQASLVALGCMEDAMLIANECVSGDTGWKRSASLEPFGS